MTLQLALPVQEELETSLQDSGHLRTLAYLYANKGPRSKALDIWKILSRSYSAGLRKDIGDSLLESIDVISSQRTAAKEASSILELSSDEELVLQHLGWVLAWLRNCIFIKFLLIFDEVVAWLICLTKNPPDCRYWSRHCCQNFDIWHEGKSTFSRYSVCFMEKMELVIFLYHCFFISLAIASFNHLLILFMLVIRVTLCLWLNFFFFEFSCLKINWAKLEPSLLRWIWQAYFHYC